MRYPTPPRAANCLIGLVASPLQMIWTYGALIENFHVAQGLDFPHTLLGLLQNYKKVIIDQLATDFPFQGGQLQQITLNTDDGATIVLVCPLATTVGHLLQAEKINLTWGTGLRIVDHSGHVLEEEDKLQQHVYYGIQHFTKKQARERPVGPLVIGIQHRENFILEVVPSGSFIFEILHKHGLGSIYFLKDIDGKIFGADYRLWHSIKLHTIEGHLGMIKRFRASGSGGPHHGLSARLMWELLQQVVHQLRCFNEETNIVPLLFVDGHCHGPWQSLHEQAEGGHIICIFAVNGHWAFLWGELSDGQGHWTYFDGLRGQLTRTAFCLSRGFHQKLGLHGFAFEQRSVYSQTHPHECGVIALAHASLVLGLPGCYSAEVITELYLWLHEHDFDDGYRASGPGGSHSETVNALADLLHSKGVPGPAARERAQQALDKLGHQPVLAALGSKNPWNRLKAEANRPNIMFRLVTPTELSQHIRERGESQFGASIKKDKKLPKKPARPGPLPPHQLDVSQLVLFDDQFVDEHDLPVKQIDFAAVVAEGRGVAICTSLMAAPYIQDGRHISTDGLALALVDLPDAETCAKACISKTPIPAKYKGTDEPVLFFGGLYQLGDSEVTRKQASNMPTPEVVSTAVLRIQAFQDVYQADWMQFIQAPIKELIAMVPALQLCREDVCSKGAIAACLKTHPAVDENFDQVILDIWARTYTTADGKKTSQHEALSFAAFLRVPSSALNSILQQQPAGIFFEPRCSATKGPDPQFKIVWLPGHDYSAALHQAKICPKSICIMRVRQRYGVRVLARDEEAAFKALRPGVPFLSVNVSTIYQLYPIPHGTQRQAIAQLLAGWGWHARPLQPGKGSAESMSWLVGAAGPPPNLVLPGFQVDILITETRNHDREVQKPTILATRKTQNHMRKEQKEASNSSDPWSDPQQDPWGQFRSSASSSQNTGPALPVKHGQQKFDELAAELKKDMHKKLEADLQAISQVPAPSAAYEQRFLTLESGLTELRSQNTQFSNWFQEMGSQQQNLTATVNEVVTKVQEQQGAIQSLHTDLQGTQGQIQSAVRLSMQEAQNELAGAFERRFDTLESLLTKKFKSNE